MKTKIYALAIALAVLPLISNAAKFELDPPHTQIAFKVTHLMVSTVRGQFNQFDGSFDFDPKSNKLKDIKVSIDLRSVTTGNEKRDNHLRSADFFNVEKNPKMIFKSTKVVLENGKPEKVIGLLTLNGKTKEVELEVDHTGPINDPFGNERIGFEAKGKIKRSDFGITWNQAIEAGGVVVSDEVKIEIDGAAVRKLTKK